MEKKGQITVGKWHFKFGIIPVFWRKRGYMFHFGIFKWISYPLQEFIITKQNYKGFWFRKEFEWQGFEINL